MPPGTPGFQVVVRSAGRSCAAAVVEQNSAPADISNATLKLINGFVVQGLFPDGRRPIQSNRPRGEAFCVIAVTLLESGKSDYTFTVPISQSVSPKEVDHFLLRIASDRSAFFDMDIAIRDTAERIVWARRIDLHYFMPRSVASEDLRQARANRDKPSANEDDERDGENAAEDE